MGDSSDCDCDGVSVTGAICVGEAAGELVSIRLRTAVDGGEGKEPIGCESGAG